MSQNVLTDLSNIGQSIWLDNISRSLIKTGELKKLIEIGLRGITSNPTIFNNSITSGKEYDEDINRLCQSGKSAFEIYDELTVKDIQDACDLFMPVYQSTNKLDGYVSLEINPKLAYEAHKSIEEAKRLHKKINRPNLMLKVPSTRQGFTAIEELIALGMNVNVTLIFSVEHYIKSAESNIRGIKRLLQKNGNPRDVHSVASVFVSRVDTFCDKMIDEFISKKAIPQKAISLKGKAAVSNCKLIYNIYLDTFYSEEFKQLKTKGANVQRVLWASTSTKNPGYSDIKYVEGLIAENTVNTIPDTTLDAVIDHCMPKIALTENIEAAQKIIEDLKNINLDVHKICEKLQEDGVKAFENSFDLLLKSIKDKTKEICKIK